MKTVSLSGTPRAYVGKKDAKKQRREGKIPCVMYGGEKQIHFTIEENKFNKIIFTPDVYAIKLNLDGKEFDAILQDIQYHPVQDHVLHADFLEVIPGKPVKVAIPIKTVGNAPGVIAGGVLFLKMKKLLLEGLLENIPEIIEVDISKLKIGDSILVKDLSIENINILSIANEAVATVKTARAAMMSVPEEDEEEEGEEGVEGAEGSEGESQESAESQEQKSE